MSDIIIYGAGKTGQALKNLFAGCNVAIYDDNTSLSQIKNVDWGKVKLVITSPGVPPHSKFLQMCAERGVPVVGELQLCCGLYTNKTVSVTGTNGKTTATQMIKHMLDACGQHSKLLGNGGIPLSQGIPQLSQDEVVVLESSSFQLKDCSNFHPEVSAFTNLAPDHLDYHLTYQNYIDAKLNNFLHQTSSQYAIFNLDDEQVVKYSQLAKAQRFFYSTQTPCNCYYDNGKVVVDIGIKQTYSFENTFLPYNLSNLLCATLCVACLGLDVGVALKSIKTFKFDDHRMQFISKLGRVYFVDDSKATNIHAVISALHSTTDDIYLILGGADKGLQFDQLVNCTEFAKVKFVACIGQTAPQIASLLQSIGVGCMVCTTLQQATQVSYHKAKQMGGMVLLSPACSSFDMFESYKHRGMVFQQCVKELGNA